MAADDATASDAAAMKRLSLPPDAPVDTGQGSSLSGRIEHMIESLERALLLVQQVFEAVRAEVTDTGEGELAELVLASQRVVNAASAVQVVGLAGIAARDEVPGPDGGWVAVDRGVGHVSEFASVTVAPMLGLTARGAEDRVQTAAALASRLPGTLSAMAAGSLDG